MTSILRLIAALVCGAIFGVGLAISGMLDPTRVRGFLDVFGHWDPSLAFVLAGAVGTSAIGTIVASLRKGPILGGTFETPSRKVIDARLVGGAAIFGVGWGLSGLCPGPALASLALGIKPIVVFTVAMLAGILFERLVPKRARSAGRASPAGSGSAGSGAAAGARARPPLCHRSPGSPASVDRPSSPDRSGLSKG